MGIGASRLRLGHLADLREREAELLALDDQREAVAVRAAEDAAAPLALRRDEPAAVIEAQRAQREAEFLGKLGDGVFGFLSAGSAAGISVGRRRSKPEYVLGE